MENSSFLKQGASASQKNRLFKNFVTVDRFALHHYEMSRSLPTDLCSDAALIARIQRGDDRGYAELLKVHLTSVRAFVAMKLPVAHLADELTHETFVFAFQNLKGFEVQHSFRAWLRAIALNLVRRELQRFARERKNQSRFQQEQIHLLISEVERKQTADEIGFLEECIASLPESMASLIADRYHKGRTSDEIAADWQRSPEWVRVTLLRVRRQLRECIETKLEVAHGH